MEQKQTSRIKLIASFLEGSVHFFVLCIAASVGASFFELICPKIISFTVDSVLGSKVPFLPAPLMSLLDSVGGLSWLRENLWAIALLILLTALCMGGCKYSEAVLNRLGSETLVETMRNRLFSHIERLPFSWYMKNRTGDIIQRCTSDVETVKAFLSEQLTSIVSTVLLITMSLLFMYDIHPVLATVALLSIPVIVAYSAIFHSKIGEGFLKCDEDEGKLSSIVQENLTGVRVVRAFGREKHEVDKYEKQNHIYTNAWIRLGRLMSLFWATGDLLSGVQVMLVLILGTVFCTRGDLSVGDLIAILSYNAMLTWPVRSLGRVISEMSKAGIAIGRVGEIMDAAEETDNPDDVECDPTGDIVFDHVTFGYDESTPILKDVSLRIPKGSTLGILGMTGSGKTTLVSLLCRLYDLPENSGSLTVSGTDIRQIRRSSLRKNIGIVLQEPYLFSRTLRDNIGITLDGVSPEETEERIRKAARTACLDETIEGFAQGYDTMVGERGVTLSGGQKQRTAIARLLTEGKPVLIFDDSLSAVDSETDAKIRSALREETTDSTVILISHRIQTLMGADHIIVLAGGRIVEEGDHSTLLQKNGIYRKIHDIQSAADEEAGKEGTL